MEKDYRTLPMETSDYKAALDRILPTVEKPARYVGGEWNQVRKDPNNITTRIALCFPDTYEIGMSHLGLKILYGLLNGRNEWSAERVYAPWPDMEARLRENDLPLASLETFTPLSQFDIVGFSLQYEMTYTNVLTMLDLGRIPIRSAGRDASHPLVIAGGPTVYSSEPIADFIDVFLIGDGEEAFPELIEKFAEIKLRRPAASRRQMLAGIAAIEGMYVPSLYNAGMDPVNRLLVVDAPADPGIPYPVRRRVVADINRFPFPSDSPVPSIEAVHDRVSVEIARGCVDGCRFCQAGTIYRPVRERDPKQIVDTILNGIENAGYDESSLTSLSTADYTCLEPLVKMLGSELEKRNVSFSVSSLRASGVSESLAREIARVRKTGFTIAPEAGTQRMRDVINKNVTEEDVMNSCSVAFSEGWSAIKMYFMIGLPSETDEDVRGIAELGRKVRELGRTKFNRAVKVTCSASYFVPKPHTPFQWCAQEDIDSIKRKQRMLKDLGRRYRIEVKVHHAETSLLEGVISRGDRRLCNVIERAWRMGCRFDGWTEWFDFHKWMEAFQSEGVALEPYLKEFTVTQSAEPRAPLARLPWDHLDTLVKPGFLAKEYIKGIKAKISPPCELPVKIIDGRPTAIAPSHEDFERVMNQPLLCYNCGMECDLTMSRRHLEGAFALHQEMRTYEQRMQGIGNPNPAPPNGTGPVVSITEKARPEKAGKAGNIGEVVLHRYRASFSKLEQVKYLSHLDMTRALPRAFRRARVKLGYSRGYHPMPLIQYGPALAVGCEGENELLEFHSPDTLVEQEFLGRINPVLPKGLVFKSLGKLPVDESSLAESIDRAEYTVPLFAVEILAAVGRFARRADSPADSQDIGSNPSHIGIHRRLAGGFLARESLVITRVRKDKLQKVDVRYYTKGLSIDEQGGVLKLITSISPNGGVKAVEVVAAVYDLTEEEKVSLNSRIRRTRLYSEGSQVNPMASSSVAGTSALSA